MLRFSKYIGITPKIKELDYSRTASGFKTDTTGRRKAAREICEYHTLLIFLLKMIFGIDFL